VRIELVKRIPIAAGLGGGSSNAANTLLGLNELFERPLGSGQLSALAASLGSDVPFFLQPNPALATGRGEQVFPLTEGLPALKGQGLLLVHPGFGISTGWAYKDLARFPEGTSGRAGQAGELAEKLQGKELGNAAQLFYNSLEFPVFYKYPLLRLYKEFLLNEGACVALMSGSGSTSFALIDRRSGEQILDRFQSRFGPPGWSALAEL
jgi:4-diphosphocytidyl-2-C-methyl-D-erythritol kinase